MAKIIWQGICRERKLLFGKGFVGGEKLFGKGFAGGENYLTRDLQGAKIIIWQRICSGGENYYLARDLQVAQNFCKGFSCGENIIWQGICK